MTDRELLELAAKAAGIRLHENQCYGTSGLKIYSDGAIPCDTRRWNPLTDDGDALRLANSCKIGLKHGPQYVDAYAELNKYSYGQATEYCLTEEERGEATRRAIVHVAAEIGKAMP